MSFEWISVKDRLPDKKQKVLGLFYNTVLKTHCIDTLYFEKPNKFNNNIVTHWMPLPEPPI